MFDHFKAVAACVASSRRHCCAAGGFELQDVRCGKSDSLHMNTCKVVRGEECFIGKPGLNYFSRISAESAEALAICMRMPMPPGASAKPHCHASHKAAIYMAKGGSELLHGPNLEFKEHKGAVLI